MASRFRASYPVPRVGPALALAIHQARSRCPCRCAAPPSYPYTHLVQCPPLSRDNTPHSGSGARLRDNRVRRRRVLARHNYDWHRDRTLREVSAPVLVHPHHGTHRQSPSKRNGHGERASVHGRAETGRQFPRGDMTAWKKMRSKKRTKIHDRSGQGFFLFFVLLLRNFFFRLLVARVAIHALFFSLHDHYGSTFIVTCGCTIAHVVVPPSNWGYCDALQGPSDIKGRYMFMVISTIYESSYHINCLERKLMGITSGFRASAYVPARPRTSPTNRSANICEHDEHGDYHFDLPSLVATLLVKR